MRRCLLQIEQLEERMVPAVFGLPWPDSAHLTLSFLPDHVQTPGGPNQLAQLLEAGYPNQSWQQEILKAFQTWAEHASINFGLVSDSGAPLGDDGVVQGDSRFGDIRLAAYPMTGEVVAIASPFDLLGGTYAGDVKFNSNQSFGAGGYDLFSVVLHEAGHVLGLDHSPDSGSALYEDYLTLRTGLTSEDISRIQALYGPRQDDAIDAQKRNDLRSDATSLSKAGSSSTLVVDADLTTRNDIDWFKFRPTGQDTSFTVQLGVSGLSLLSARLSVHDKDGTLVQQLAASTPGSDLSFHLSSLEKNSDYFIKVEAASNDVFAIGSYRLEVIPQGGLAPNRHQHDEPAGNPDNRSAGATNLQQKSYSTDARFDYVTRASLNSSDDVDFYRFTVPNPPGNQTSQVVTVMVWGTEGTGVRPQAQLFSSNGTPLDGEILVNQDGSLIFQYVLEGSGSYLVSVAHGAGSNTLGCPEYFLGVDLGMNPITLDPLVTDRTITSLAPQVNVFHVTESQLFHLVLSAGTGTGSVSLEILDSQGHRVGLLSAGAGGVSTDTLFLRAGSYQMRFTGTEGLTYSLRLRGLSNPIGPTPLDPRLAPLPVGTQGISGSGYLFQTGFTGLIVTSPSPAPLPTAPTLSTTPTSPLPILTPEAIEVVLLTYGDSSTGIMEGALLPVLTGGLLLTQPSTFPVIEAATLDAVMLMFTGQSAPSPVSTIPTSSGTSSSTSGTELGPLATNAQPGVQQPAPETDPLEPSMPPVRSAVPEPGQQEPAEESKGDASALPKPAQPPIKARPRSFLPPALLRSLFQVSVIAGLMGSVRLLGRRSPPKGSR